MDTSAYRQARQRLPEKLLKDSLGQVAKFGKKATKNICGVAATLKCLTVQRFQCPLQKIGQLTPQPPSLGCGFPWLYLCFIPDLGDK